MRKAQLIQEVHLHTAKRAMTQEKVDPSDSTHSTTGLITKKSVCIDILKSGYPQAFVDFFYLSHRSSPVPTATSTSTSTSAGANPPTVAYPSDKKADIKYYHTVRDYLCEVEEAKRKGDVHAVYLCYEKLRNYFMSFDDTVTSLFYGEKCYQSSKVLKDTLRELQAVGQLGHLYKKVPNYLKAMECNELQFQLANTMGEPNVQKQAEEQMNQSYENYGQECEAREEYSGAIAVYQKGISQTKDQRYVGLFKYRLGKCYVALDDISQAKEYFMDYLKIKEANNDYHGQCEAYVELAFCEKKMSSLNGAHEFLNHLLVTASSGSSSAGGSSSTGGSNNSLLSYQAYSYQEQGLLYYKEKQYDKAIHMLEKNYDLRVTMGAHAMATQKEIEDAAMYVGCAKADQKCTPYVSITKTDLSKLLRWKNQREVF